MCVDRRIEGGAAWKAMIICWVQGRIWGLKALLRDEEGGRSLTVVRDGAEEDGVCLGGSSTNPL